MQLVETKAGEEALEHVAMPLDGVEDTDGPLCLDDAVRERANGGEVVCCLRVRGALRRSTMHPGTAS